MRRYIVLFILYFIIYLLLSGGTYFTDVFFAAVVAAIASALTAKLLVRNEEKLELRRLYYLLKYFFRYMLVDEIRAHIDVARRVLTGEIRPGIVAVPYYVGSDYAKTLIANSITNTPGTVVVGIDDREKLMYVHWIDVKALDPSTCRMYISRVFEEYAMKIFE